VKASSGISVLSSSRDVAYCGHGDFVNHRPFDYTPKCGFAPVRCPIMPIIVRFQKAHAMMDR